MEESKVTKMKQDNFKKLNEWLDTCPFGCLLYTSPSPRDLTTSRMPSSA